jgi:hypothetical protein
MMTIAMTMTTMTTTTAARAVAKTKPGSRYASESPGLAGAFGMEHSCPTMIRVAK